MKNFKVLATVSVISMLLVFTGCCAALASEEPIVIIIAHTDTEERSTHVASLEFQKFMAEKTNGRVQVNVYPNGQLGGDEDITRGLQMGTCHLQIVSNTLMATSLGPRAELFDLPFLFDGYESWNNAMKNGGKALYDEQMKGSGYQVLGFAYEGARNMLTRVKQINTLEDMQGLKIRINNTELFLSTYKALGANPTPMTFGEVYTALTQGMVDGVDHIMCLIDDQKYQEPAKHLTMTRHIISPCVYVVAEGFVDSLPADIQPIFLEGVQAMCDRQTEIDGGLEVSLVDVFREQGVEVTELSAEERAKFEAAVQPIYDQYRGILGDELMDKVLEIAGKK